MNDYLYNPRVLGAYITLFVLPIVIIVASFVVYGLSKRNDG